MCVKYFFAFRLCYTVAIMLYTVGTHIDLRDNAQESSPEASSESGLYLPGTAITFAFSEAKKQLKIVHHIPVAFA